MALEGEVELDHSTTVSMLVGPAFGELSAPAGLGDVDGDGLSDFVVADPDYAHGGSNAVHDGAAYLYNGRRHPIALRQAAAESDGVLSFSSRPTFELRPAGLGDVDGDGHADFAIAARDFDARPLSALVFRGGAEMFEGLSTEQATPFEGPEAGIASMGSLADLDDDGYDDFFAEVPGPGDSSTVHVFYGGPERLSIPLAVDDADVHLEGLVSARRPEAGDFDGDGHLDIAMLLGGVDQTPRVVILYGTGERIVGGGVAQMLSTVVLVDEAASNLTALDFDGDGASELVLGTLAQPAILPGGTRWDPSTVAGWVPLLPDHAGTLTPSRVGDLDGDGADDLAFIAGDGASVLFAYGRADLLGLAIDAELVLPALDESGPHATAVVEAGDLNGDGFGDFLIADSTRCEGCGSGGAVYAVYGAARD